VAGKDCQDGVAGPVCYGDSRIGKAADRRGDSRNDFKAKSGRREFPSLLPPTPEEERISSLESDDALPLTGVFHEQGIRLLLS